MGVSGYRLDNSHQYALIWLWNEADGLVSGLAGQSYEQHTPSTAPDKLYLQERTVDWGRDAVSKQSKLTAVLSEVVRALGPEGNRHVAWLKLVYGKLRRQDLHAVLGRDLAPLARFTPVVEERARQRWPYWYADTYADDYALICKQSPKNPGLAMERMMMRIPDEPPAYQLEIVAEGVVERAVNPMNRDEPLVLAMTAQADAMLSAASRSFQEAWSTLEALEKKTKDERRKSDKMLAAKSVDQVAALDQLLMKMRRGVAA